jgi:hypothetical protein
MGWTHYWKRHTTLPASDFGRAVADICKVLAHIGVELVGPGMIGKPHLTQNTIAFNGREGCEPFEVRQTERDRHGRSVFWAFCKTEKAPYDLCVQAALIVLQHHLGDDIKVSSDGNDADWDRARTVCQQCLGYGEGFTLSRE